MSGVLKNLNSSSLIFTFELQYSDPSHLLMEDTLDMTPSLEMTLVLEPSMVNVLGAPFHQRTPF